MTAALFAGAVLLGAPVVLWAGWRLGVLLERRGGLDGRADESIAIAQWVTAPTMRKRKARVWAEGWQAGRMHALEELHEILAANRTGGEHALDEEAPDA